MKSVNLERFFPNHERIYVFDVPASKSLLNRALILAAFTKGVTTIKCGTYGEDTQAVIDCLSSLGIECVRTESGILVRGCGKNIPNKTARLNVMSAGTCARFLPAVLAMIGGDYLFDSSEQMKHRPMEFLDELKKAGAEFTFLNEENRFPFRMRSDGFQTREFVVNTDISTQYASALLLAGALGKEPVRIRLTGTRTQGSYIQMTLALLKAFGASYQIENDIITVEPIDGSLQEFEAEADLSAACYFYALSLLFGIKVLVRRVKKNSLQGDIKFLRLLKERGVRLIETDEGLLLDGSGISSFAGFTENLNDYSDQALTVAALAPFASSPSRLTGIGHIRRQECDRIAAIQNNLTALGVPCRAGDDFVEIAPTNPKGGTVTTYGDHRVAMSFALTALKAGNITIDDIACCSKTFIEYFDELKKLYT